MRVLKSKKRTLKDSRASRVKSSIRRGDTVMVISGGNGDKRPLVGQTGKVTAIVGKNKDRVIVEGLNMVTRHQRQTSPEKPGGKMKKEASIHISNVMYYAEKLKKPVRLRHSVLADGKKVRGYVDPESKQFVQV
ncbi:MAG: 50S ribosomal protein L24 [Deltaproteobacteria bacterium]|nr:50S ribosomal protein L24 [Deltaproteobacteria bacterium]